MVIFNYVAKDHAGKSFKGKVEARDERQAVAILRSRQMVVINITAESKAQFGNFLEGINRIKSTDLVQFTQQLATMINSGLPLSDALELLRFQSKPAMAKILGEISHDIQGGASIGDAMAKHPTVFNKVYVSLVRVGELAGKLDEVLTRLAENEEKAHEFNVKAKGALIYPIIVTIAMVGVVTVMMVVVVPSLPLLPLP